MKKIKMILSECKDYKPTYEYQHVIEKVVAICEDAINSSIKTRSALSKIYDLTTQQCDTGFYDSTIMAISEMSCPKK